MFYFQNFLILKSWSYFPSIHWLNPSLWFLYGGSLPVVIVVAGLAVERVGVQVPVKQCPPGHAELTLSDLLVLYNVTVKSMNHCCILVSGGGGGGGLDTIKWYVIYNIFGLPISAWKHNMKKWFTIINQRN